MGTKFFLFWKDSYFNFHECLPKIVSVLKSGCQDLIVLQTADPISAKFGRKAKLNHVGIIAIVLYI